jgi:hypothetical protein
MAEMTNTGSENALPTAGGGGSASSAGEFECSQRAGEFAVR